MSLWERPIDRGDQVCVSRDDITLVPVGVCVGEGQEWNRWLLDFQEHGGGASEAVAEGHAPCTSGRGGKQAWECMWWCLRGCEAIKEDCLVGTP